jgi:hypothetical protein
MNFIKKRIERAFKRNELICICINRIIWNNRIIGYVNSINKSGKFKINILDEYGQIKNTKTFTFFSVKSLEIGGTYNENLGRLNKSNFSKHHSTPKYFNKRKNNLFAKIDQLANTNKVCTFYFGSEYSIGVVKAVASGEFTIMNISFEGKEDGESIFDINLLTKIRYDSNFEIKITLLRNDH